MTTAGRPGFDPGSLARAYGLPAVRQQRARTRELDVPDVERDLRELHRVLRPRGPEVLVDTDWRSCVWRTDDRQRTDEVLRRWEGHVLHPQLAAGLAGLARATGFVDVEVHAPPRWLFSLTRCATVVTRGPRD